MALKFINLRFPIYFSKKIAGSKDSKKNLSRFIIFIGRVSVALGIVISLITISTGIGSKKAIKSSLSDFSGELTIKSTRSNSSYNSSPLDSKNIDFNKIKSLQNVAATQKFITTNGILRTKDNFAGIILKGVGENFNRNRFNKFIVKGKIPQFKDNEANQEIVISQKISKDINKGVNDSVVAIFAKEQQKPIYRKFKISGIYKTDIKMIDDLYIIGGINHARKVQNFGTDEIGGLEVFLKDNDNINETAINIEKFIGLKNYIEKITEQFPQIVSWMEIFDTNIALIISIMLIVVVVNIIMILLILIIERTNSIGLLKTLGATNGQIRAIFINYTLMIMFPGLLVGNILGIGLLLVQRWYGIIKLNPENYYVSVVPVDLNIIYIAGVSVGILVVSGVSLILPSYLISKISPIKSIKMS